MTTLEKFIFPIYFNNNLTAEDSHSRLKLLEDYCNDKNGTSIKLLGKDEPNIYARGLTKRMVANRYRKLADKECMRSPDNPSLAPVYIHPILNFGLGVFAEKAIAKGTYIMDYQGRMHWADDKDDENGRYAIELSVPPFGKQMGFALDASSVGGIGRFLNHSCEPNTEATPVLMNGLLRVVIMAIRDIQPNEHLCWCYGADYFKERGIVCFCGTDSCQIKPRTKRDRMEGFSYRRCIEGLGRSLGKEFVDQETQCELIPQSPSGQPEASSTGRGTKRKLVEDEDPDKSVEEVENNSVGSGIGQGPMDRSRKILKVMYDNGGIVEPDIKLVSKDNIILKAHSGALSMSSPVLYDLIEEEIRKMETSEEPTSEGMITLPQVDGQTLTMILHWIYRDELPQYVGEHFEAVANAAIYLQMSGMVRVLEKRLISEYTLVDMGKAYLLAEMYQKGMPEALPKILEFIQRDLEVTLMDS